MATISLLDLDLSFVATPARVQVSGTVTDQAVPANPLKRRVVVFAEHNPADIVVCESAAVDGAWSVPAIGSAATKFCVVAIGASGENGDSFAHVGVA